MSGKQRVSEKGQRSHFSMIPHLLDDLDLSQKAYRLYGHLKRVAGEKGKCEEGVDTMAKKCRMNKDTLIKAKRELESKKLIEVKPASDRTKPDELIILDVWSRNSEQFDGDSEEGRVPKEGTRPSQKRERVVSQKRERKKIRKEDKEDTPPLGPPQKTSARYKPSSEEYETKCRAFFESDGLASEVRVVADRATRKNRTGEMSWSRTWSGFIEPITEARKEHSDDAIRYALQETNRLEKDDLRYTLAILRNGSHASASKQAGDKPLPKADNGSPSKYDLKAYLNEKYPGKEER